MSLSIEEILKQETKNINNLSNRIYFNNKILFHSVGLNNSDIKSIFDMYVFNFINKYGEEKRKFLYKFLKHRGLNLIKICTRKSKKIIESNNYTSRELNIIFDNYIHCDTPEEILIAKESVKNLLKEQ